MINKIFFLISLLIPLAARAQQCSYIPTVIVYEKDGYRPSPEDLENLPLDFRVRKVVEVDLKNCGASNWILAWRCAYSAMRKERIASKKYMTVFAYRSFYKPETPWDLFGRAAPNIFSDYRLGPVVASTESNLNFPEESRASLRSVVLRSFYLSGYENDVASIIAARLTHAGRHLKVSTRTTALVPFVKKDICRLKRRRRGWLNG